LTLFEKKYLNIENYGIQPQIHRGILHHNRNSITQLMDYGNVVLGL